MAGGFAILIACLGLFGQASLTIVQRTKEIGIRKAFGATVKDILTLLSSDMAKLVLISNVLAWPAAYYASSEWLESFAYRITLGPTLFLVGGLMASVVAAMTVGWIGIRAARGNPVEALRTE